MSDTVTLLVPQDHTPTTVSPYPTFFWYLPSKISLPLRFTLLEPGKNPIYTKELIPEAGITTLKLPENVKPLKVGKIYRWTVTVICNENKPSRNLFAQAWVERVSLEKRNDDIANHKCNTLAQAGVWYDALHCFYITKSETSSDERREFWSLLKEVELNSIAKQ